MAAQKPRILQLGVLSYSQASWDKLASIAELVETKATTRAEFFEECRSDLLDGVVAILRTYDSVKITGRFDAELISELPKSVGFVCHNGAGYDQIDCHVCAERNPPIRVSNVHGEADNSTADTAIFLLLGALRAFLPALEGAGKGVWRKHPDYVSGHDPQGKTLGIIGMGRIGRNFKRKANAFGLKTIYHNRNRLPVEQEDGAKYVTMDELLAQSDVISMHLPLNNNTRHTLSDKQFDQMKTGVVIVNTARGPVIDEEALVRALESGKVYSCGLDVFENEPKIHPGLLKHPRTIVMPHVGTSSIETQTGMEEQTIGNVRSVLETGKLSNIVPEQTSLGLGP